MKRQLTQTTQQPLNLNLMKNYNKESFLVITSLFAVALVCLFPELSIAGTGGEELADVVTKTEGLISGNGGKLVALGSVIMGVIWSAASGSVKNLVVPVILGMVLGIGPSIVTGGISAII
jgi:hypothetical protein